MDEWERVNAVNAAGVMLGCKHGIRAMKSSGGGAIVNIASVAALVASPLAVPYGASKAAVVQLTRTVAFDCARRGYGIRCNAVLPGAIETAMYMTSFSAAQRAANARGIPVGRVGAPLDVAKAVAFSRQRRRRLYHRDPARRGRRSHGGQSHARRGQLGRRSCRRRVIDVS